MADQVREIAIDGGDGCVAPSAETITDASYPLSRSLYIYVNNEKLSQSEALQAYVDYYLTDEALNQLVSEVGYIPLPTDRIEATRGVWAEAACPASNMASKARVGSKANDGLNRSRLGWELDDIGIWRRNASVDLELVG